MSRRYFIIVPALVPTGPVKGAIALANALSDHREVTLLSLKPGSVANAEIDQRVTLLKLYEHADSLLGRIDCYRDILRRAGGRRGVTSISMCFSADMVNLLCRHEAVICSSIRGNLSMNYRMDYGMLGLPLAWLHLLTMRLFDHVTVMTQPMADQVCRFLGRTPWVIGNFVDESALETYRREHDRITHPRFVFLGSLSQRKRPELVVQAIRRLRDRKVMATLDILGSGPLETELKALIFKLNLEKVVTMHGQVAQPYSLVASADALVLPSLSEGIPRAALEALHLGTPCVLREVDGNGALIRSGWNGVLFQNDDELVEAMANVSTLTQCHSGSLIPDGFRQKGEVECFLKLLEA